MSRKCSESSWLFCAVAVADGGDWDLDLWVSNEGRTKFTTGLSLSWRQGKAHNPKCPTILQVWKCDPVVATGWLFHVILRSSGHVKSPSACVLFLTSALLYNPQDPSCWATSGCLFSQQLHERKMRLIFIWVITLCDSLYYLNKPKEDARNNKKRIFLQ